MTTEGQTDRVKFLEYFLKCFNKEEKVKDFKYSIRLKSALTMTSIAVFECADGQLTCQETKALFFKFYALF